MSYSLASLIQQCRYLSGDTAVTPVFSDDQLQDFINRAVADLSQHFPRRIAHTLTTTAGKHAYNLPQNTLAVLSAEYPAGQSPPRYLRRRAAVDHAFYRADDLYDLKLTSDSASLNPPQLVISADPAEGETIALEISAEHNPLTASSDLTSVQDRHVHLIGLFVRWKCLQELSTTEAMDPDPLHLLSMTQELNAKRAEAQYRAALEAARAAYGESAAARWSVDKWDGWY